MSTSLRWLFVLALPVCFHTALPCAAQQAGAPPGLIVGRILDQDSRRPISGASVAVDDSIVRAITDNQGRFAIDGIRPGPLHLTFSMIGYTARSDTVMVVSGRTQSVEATLSQEAIQLEPISVSVRSGWLESSGFYEREADNSGGHFVDRAEIEQRQPRRLTDLLRDMPGIRTMNLRAGQVHVRFNREGGGDALAFDLSGEESLPGCEPDLYLDGILYRENSLEDETRVADFDVVDAMRVEGIEAYSGPTSPLQYQSSCGVILIWTSRGSPTNMERRAPVARAANGVTMPLLDPGTMIRVRPRFGDRVTGQVALIDADSLVLEQSGAQSTYNVMNMRSLERDGGLASPLDRMRRGGKWGFVLTVIGVALTGAAEEFQALNQREDNIPDNSVRRPAFAMKIITAGTLTGALLGGSVWRYRNWINVPIR